MKVDLRPDLIAARTHQHWEQWDSGTGSKTVYHLTKTPSNLTVYISGLAKRPSVPGTAHDYTWSGSTVTFTVAPANGADILFAQVSS